MLGIPSLLAILPLKNSVIFPGVTQVLKVGRERSLAALKESEKNGFFIIASQQKSENLESPVGVDDVHRIGTVCKIESMRKDSSGYQVVLKGLHRARLENIKLISEKYLHSDFVLLSDDMDVNDSTELALLDSLKSASKNILKLLPGHTDSLAEHLEQVRDLSLLTSLCAGNLEFDLTQKQKLLELLSIKERTLLLLNLMQDFKENLQVQNEIRGKLNQKIGQSQRQHILREQLKAIREELGEEDQSSNEEKLSDQINTSSMPDDVKKMAQKELQRLSQLGSQSPETHIIRNYLDLLLSLPWTSNNNETELSLDFARQVLNEDHEGLEKIKNRIVQHLAVMKLKKNQKGSILLFVGPPGVGKTSLGESIARALSRKFARISLGGVRDDAEIRGHRRTYVGAMPGRIIQALKRTGEKNPVLLFDEIDKLSRGYGGDPAAALLEVLDPEQNSHFLDHYLDVGFDLSDVFFIATANSLDTIPAPLLDRMEIIELPGYTTNEKLGIAKRHLLPKALKEFGLSENQVLFSDEIFIQLIQKFTRESGVRDLQRKITGVLRGLSEKILSVKEPIQVTFEILEEHLGSPRFETDLVPLAHPPGVATGLAWTPVGGDVLFIESTAMPGQGQLILTGQLGDVMKESAQIALSLIRTHIAAFDVQVDLAKTDFHLHVPAGSIPKDGPSAGITMLSSLVSLVTGLRIDPKLAMTGEITLRGQITPVGGVKEKVIAAHRAGVKKIILCRKNERDLKEIPENGKEDLEFIFVETVPELLNSVFNGKIQPQGFKAWTSSESQEQSPVLSELR